MENREPTETVVVAIEFVPTGRVVSARVHLGSPTRVKLPAVITWPDGSRSNVLEIVVEQMSEGGPATNPRR